MRWQDIDTRYPDGGVGIDALLSSRARGALGFATEPRDKALLDAEYHAFTKRWRWKDEVETVGRFAMLAALEGEWDLVGDCTGAPLGNRVVIKKTFGDNVAGLARHLATIARGRLPATHAAAAMDEVRARFRDASTPDPRLLVVATQLFVRDIVRADAVIDETRAFLDGATLELDAARPVAAPADGEDPRVKIFERYAPELSEDVAIRGALAQHARGEPWSRDQEAARRTLDDLVIRAYVARLPLPVDWAVLVDPVVASWLGADPPGVETRFRDLERLRPAGCVPRGEWADAVFGLAVGAQPTFRELAERGQLPKWKPGAFFKDDARKLIRYLGAAIGALATEDTVLPAWLDFLARRSPATTPLLASERGELRWKHLLAIQSAITHRIGRRDRGEVGRALQQIVSGA